MTYIRFFEQLTKRAIQAVRGSFFVALAIVAAFSLLATQPAQAQNADVWKSVAIIGGSTAAGAYIGHKVAGGTGALVGAGIGATAGYAIDRHRRQNEYNNQYGYGNGGYYPGPSGYYGGSYYPGLYNGSAYPPGYSANYRSRYSRH